MIVKGILFLYVKRYAWSYWASFKYILDEKLGLFLVLSSFLPIGSSKGYVLTSSTACRSAAEMNEMSGYGTVP